MVLQSGRSIGAIFRKYSTFLDHHTMDHNHDHSHQHELLFVTCVMCGSSNMIVAVMEGALLFDCADCRTEVGMIDNVQEDTHALLAKGCKGH